MTEKQLSRSTRGVETLLAVIIAILSILTAYAAFMSAQIDLTSTDNYFLAQSLLNDANSLYLERGQDIIYDFEAFDSFIIYAETDPDLSDYFLNAMSDAALSSIDRPDGPFDQAYYDEMYSVPNEILEDEELFFESAAHDSNRAVAYQLTVLIMAVGLSFAAWASLASKQKLTRFIFLLLSVSALIIGLGQMLFIPGPLI